MANKAWLKLTWKDGRTTYNETSRSKTYPFASTRQLQRRSKPVEVSNQLSGSETIPQLPEGVQATDSND